LDETDRINSFESTGLYKYQVCCQIQLVLSVSGKKKNQFQIG